MRYKILSRTFRARCSFEEVIMRFKNDSLHESTEEDEEGSEIR